MATGMRTSYTDTTPHIRVVTDMIHNIDPRDVPLIFYLGLSNQDKFRFKDFPSTKVEWLEDTLSPTTDTLAEALDNSETGVDVTDGTLYQPGTVFQVDDEKFWVSSVSSNTLTVIRGWGSTSAVTHDNAATITILFTARLEGDESDDGHSTAVTAPYNYAQILHKEIKVSRTDRRVSKYGIDDQYNYELMKIMGGSGGGGGKRGRAGELTIALEKTAFYGERLQGSGSVARAMGGLDTFITTNTTDLSSAALDPKTLEDAIQDCWEAGGMPDVIVCNGWVKRKITSFFAGAVRTERSERMGGTVIESVETEFGTLDLLLDRWCPSNKMYILQSDKVGWVTIDKFFEEKLAKTGDYTRGQVVGEYSFVVMNEEAHAIIDNVSITS